MYGSMYVCMYVCTKQTNKQQNKPLKEIQPIISPCRLDFIDQKVAGPIDQMQPPPYIFI